MTKNPRDYRYCFKLLCPDSLVLKILGNKGSAKDNIQVETGAKIVFSNQGEYYPGTYYRLMGIYADGFDPILGTIDRIVPHLIIECAQEDEQNPDYMGKEEGEYVVRIAIPRAMCGELIGQKGGKIQILRKETGCKIFLENDVLHDHQMLRIIGGADLLRNCVGQMVDVHKTVSENNDIHTWAQLLNFSQAGEAEYSAPQATPARKKLRPNSSWSTGSGRGGEGGGVAEGAIGDAGGHVEALKGVIQSFPGDEAQLEYSLTFTLPKLAVDALKLEGRKDELEQATGTTIELPEDPESGDGVAEEEVEDPYATKSVSVVGSLLGMYSAHLMVLQKVHEIEKQQEEAQKEEELNDLSVDELKAKVRELQAQLAEAKKLGFVPVVPEVVSG
jgi:hypothetical protein